MDQDDQTSEEEEDESKRKDVVLVYDADVTENVSSVKPIQSFCLLFFGQSNVVKESDHQRSLNFNVMFSTKSEWTDNVARDSRLSLQPAGC